MASKARSWVISEGQAGQLVYYFRRGKKEIDIGYRGPAKVIAVENDRVVLPWLHGKVLLER